MFILGINAYHADSSAAIFREGQILAAIEEERFRRVKHWAGFPAMAIDFCLKEAGITIDQVDYIAIGRDPKAKFFKKILFFLRNPSGSLGMIQDRLFNRQKIISLQQELHILTGSGKDFLKRKICHIEHHRSHLASAFFASPFKEAALLSIDGSGDFTTTMTGVGNDKSIKIFDSVDFPHSMGLFYTAFTQFLGFSHYGDEYKIMGLAPYGEPLYVDQLKSIVRFTDNGLFKLDLSYFRQPNKGFVSYKNNMPVVAPLFSDKIIRQFGLPRQEGEPISKFHKDVASSVQQLTELIIFHILNHLHTKTGLPNICIAGGVAQNSVANGKIMRNTGFTNVYVPPAGHDAGISMGAALYVQHQILKKNRSAPVFNAYMGSRFSNADIESLLKSRNICYRKLENSAIYDIVTNKLIEGAVVGWFRGRSEFGPRALGGRSILADPRRSDARHILNTKIKRRESFRPFAPSILKEYVTEYFGVTDTVPFMEKVYPVLPEKRGCIPAVTHVDGTGRLQTVDKEISPGYYDLIDCFRKKTGIPMLLNTSFNENEPIVNSPGEALECFLRTDMDMLIMENIVVER